MSQAAAKTAHQRGFLSRLGGGARNSLALVGVATVTGLYFEYKATFPEKTEEKETGEATKKKVLVIPFEKLRVVEKKNQKLLSLFEQVNTENEDKQHEIELRELVDLIHSAASDPSVACLYGTFGNGSVGSMGYAQLEEIREALRTFKEAHRRHTSPNIGHHQLVIPLIESKPMYAYADHFNTSSNAKEYYLASIFSNLHMQHHGFLDLAGWSTSQIFVRDFLEKYGVRVHSFKCGVWKNAPDMFTRATLSKPHRENITSLVSGIHADACEEISAARSKHLLGSWLKHKSTIELWKRIHGKGSFTAIEAWKAGLIDHLPRRDPLLDLVESNESTEKKEAMKALWKLQETDFEKFKASKVVSLMDYAKQMRKKKIADKKKKQLGELAKKYTVVKETLQLVGLNPDVSSSKEKIALLHLDGPITSGPARKLVESIRKIRKDKDTKCVVFRLGNCPGGDLYSSEKVLQELKALDVPVVVSFGNVAASGGYFISMNANRIFAMKKTITGSIGVFALKFDLRGLAEQYGVNVQVLAENELATADSVFHPLTRKVKQLYGERMDLAYEGFKTAVSEGRKLSMDEVEALAQGRVWTGRESKENGLIDEIGGLHRAIAYATREFTESGEADVVVWPKEKSPFEKVMAAYEGAGSQSIFAALQDWALGMTKDAEGSSRMDSESVTKMIQTVLRTPRASGSGIYLTVDEDSAIRCLLKDANEKYHDDDNPYSVGWE